MWWKGRTSHLVSLSLTVILLLDRLGNREDPNFQSLSPQVFVVGRCFTLVLKEFRLRTSDPILSFMKKADYWLIFSINVYQPKSNNPWPFFPAPLETCLFAGLLPVYDYPLKLCQALKKQWENHHFLLLFLLIQLPPSWDTITDLTLCWKDQSLIYTPIKSRTPNSALSTEGRNDSKWGYIQKIIIPTNMTLVIWKRNVAPHALRSNVFLSSAQQ